MDIFSFIAGIATGAVVLLIFLGLLKKAVEGDYREYERQIRLNNERIKRALDRVPDKVEPAREIPSVRPFRIVTEAQIYTFPQGSRYEH